MVDAMVSVVLEQLISTAIEEAKERVRLVKGVGTEVKLLQDNFEAIQAVLVDADRRQMAEEPVRLWLEKLKYASYDMEDVLDEWNTARLKLQIEGVDMNALAPRKRVCSFFPASSCFGSKKVFLRHDIAQEIKEINKNLDAIHRQKDMFNFSVIRSTERSERMHSTALIDVSDVCGRVGEKSTLKSKLLGEGSEQQNAVQTISLVGMGGIGKTTLAQFVYNDNDVINHFGKRIWVCVSDPFDEYRIAKAIIEALEGSATNLVELNALLLRINESIAREKFLLVLDDVWTEDYNKWESFRRCLINGQRGSKILVTTRKEIVAGTMDSTDVISIKELSERECWSLFERIAFSNRPRSECEQLEEIGRKIVSKCKGLPLAVKTIGSLLRFKRSLRVWQSILDSQMWQLEEFERGLLAPLLMSYNDLPPTIKRCFLYCAIFPKDYRMDKDELIKLWLAQGYIRPKENKELEMIGQEYFDYLATRSFFQEFETDDYDGLVVSCKMHDIVHDFAQYLTKNECFSTEANGREEPLSLINTPKEKLRHSMLILGYEASFPDSLLNAKKLRSFLIHNSPYDVFSPALPRLFDQLTCLRTLKIVAGGFWSRGMIREIPKEIEKLIHLRFLQLHDLMIDELPKTCCELFNLQTLEIRQFGYYLRSLPHGFGKLENLRHLSEFVVGITGSRNDSRSRGCKLEVLGQLRHLRGSLRIRGLGNVKDVDEAKSAELENKVNLLHLGLWFDKELIEAMNEENGAKDEAIIEALRPPPNLESLEISVYKGKTLFPIWIVSSCKLKKLRLTHCRSVKLPPLGQWPLLEVLIIDWTYTVKTVDDEFLGIQSRDRLHGIGTSSSVIAFPKLKQLQFSLLEGWEEWDFGKEDNITIMPQLKTLKISNCSKLKSVPDQLLQSTTLEELWISQCPILEERFKKDTGEDWSNISHIPNIRFKGDYVQGGPG
ncbi:hypothetical protein AB3S75_002513 [Citrus x aurantiifolia]